MRLQALQRQIIKELQAKDITTAALDARLLIGHAFGLTQEGVLREAERVLIPSEHDAIRALLLRRLAREPMAYILGYRVFWGMALTVTPDVLIPRPDSEMLVEAVCRHRPDRQGIKRILDIGTGSGCLLLALLKEYPEANGVGLDRSAAALAVACENGERLGFRTRVRWLESHWCDALGNDGIFDLIVSNPPYISTEEMESLQPDVREYEPEAALHGGEDGLDPYRVILPQIQQRLEKGGLCVVEIGSTQADAVHNIGEACGLHYHETAKDLAGFDRCVVFSQE
ncbi:MAG: peptide chain release factor N(5)-glutamine methyltransferase [Rickettsiales bacterium]|nr:peptide chain release factor N(5)-glutamine methyltransferase [Rickettsiales bacterium]